MIAATGAVPPVDDLGLVDLEPVIVVGGEARRLPDGAVDVDQDATSATDEVMVVVTHPILVTRGGPGRQNPAGEAPLDQRSQGVVHRLPGNRSDAPSDVVGELVGGGMRVGRHRPQHGQPLGGDLQPLLPQEPLGVLIHGAESITSSGLSQVLAWIDDRGHVAAAAC